MSKKQAHLFAGMKEVEANYVASKLSDTEFAKSISTPEATYTKSQICSYRQSLGIPNNTPDGRTNDMIRAKDLLTQALDRVDDGDPLAKDIRDFLGIVDEVVE